MKKLNKKHCLVVALLFGLGAMLTVLPAQLPAQDIDDVIGGLDQDFSLGGKQEVKQSNVAAANEQNREDIKLKEEEEINAGGATVTGNIIISFTGGPPTQNFNLHNIIVNGTAVPINQIVSIPGGTISVPINNVTVPSGISFALGLDLTCNTSPTCNVTLAFSGVLNCSIPPINMIDMQRTTFSATCSTAVAP